MTLKHILHGGTRLHYVAFSYAFRSYFQLIFKFNNVELTASRLQEIEDEINQRPRKTLNIKSPSELEYKLAA